MSMSETQMTMTETNLERLLERFRKISQDQPVEMPTARFRSYAVSNFRGGIGKSTLAFNLAWEISRSSKALFFDLCPQANFTQSLIGEIPEKSLTVYDAVLSRLMPGTDKPKIDDLLVAVAPYCSPFKGGQSPMMIPGAKELFLLPSLLYTQINTTSQLPPAKARAATKNILKCLADLADEAHKAYPFSKLLIDTSPFFGGGTHLAWESADALIIPVRVDQHSMEALKLTLDMLRNHSMDFVRMNDAAGIATVPKVHAIAMTHCGWNRQSEFTPDRSTQAYLQKVCQIANEYSDLFSDTDPLKCIHLLDDFHSAGRISGTQRTPLAKLNVGDTFVISGQRLKVNISLTRYQKEIKALASTL